MAEHVGRGGLKLEAAVARFALGPRLRGARAVDVGAGTGGFTEVLLAHGAAHVTAVDVGHGQLHQRLRGDRRVTSLEAPSGNISHTRAQTIASGRSLDSGSRTRPAPSTCRSAASGAES